MNSSTKNTKKDKKSGLHGDSEHTQRIILRAACLKIINVLCGIEYHDAMGEWKGTKDDSRK
jgi:hypothetical protein